MTVTKISGHNASIETNYFHTTRNRCSAVAQMGDCLATIDTGRKLGVCPFWVGPFWGSWIPMQHNVAWACTKWHLDPSNHFTTTDIGQKLGAAPFGGGASWVCM